jgi:hypothetical protein
VNANLYPSARVIAETAPLSREALALLGDLADPRDCLETLRAAGLHGDCLVFLPHILDRRRAVWWACLCCFDAYRDGMPPALADALERALRWLFAPSDSHRDACRGEARPLPLNSPENCLRMAVVWSGGSLAPPTLPEVPPPPDLTARCSSGAVLIAAASRGTFEIADRHRLYVDLGYEVLDGRLMWTATSAADEVRVGTAVVA